MNFFDSVFNLLNNSVPNQKVEDFNLFYKEYRSGLLSFDNSTPAVIFEHPSYYNYLTITSPKNVPKRKRVNTNEGRAILIHSLLHIEYSAIDLALDACYRFRDLPKQFYDDWLEVADDEVRHFLMLKELLLKCGYKYGDFEVHDELFKASMKSLKLIERMALIPRYMEANGLDSNVSLKSRIISSGVSKDDELIKALDIIRHEEVSHVKKGDIWFKYACKQENISPELYFDIVNSIYPNSFTQNKELNIEDRIKAGFSEDEINRLKKFKK